MEKSKFSIVGHCKAGRDITAEIALFEFHCENTVSTSGEEENTIADMGRKSLLSCLKSHVENCPDCTKLTDG